MSALDDLILKIEDPELRQKILTEVKRATRHKKFGLVFEEHLPECTALYDVPIKEGNQVARKGREIDEIFLVKKIKNDKAVCVSRTTKEDVKFSINDIVVIAEFGEPIYPYLSQIDSVCNAPDSSLWHTLIEADNYHALQLLEYLYAGKVDCIYIDPPYNTGAKDWKYNNDYVDKNDSYRHSKWLSMMERRLRLAKKLLNPSDSILIVTIDEKEYLHLGCLLEELFQGCDIQMVTSVINPKGSARKNMFSRAEEYLFFVFIGNSCINHGYCDMLHAPQERPVRWASLLRSGTNSLRKDRPNLFYPIFFNKSTGKFHSVGESLDLSVDRNTVICPAGCFAVWPINSNGDEARWGLGQKAFTDKNKKGYIKFGPWKHGDKSRTISHLQDGTISALLRGEIEVLGKDDDGGIITGKSGKTVNPLTVWSQSAHSASDYGSTLLNSIFVTSRFTFPKSLYAVKDTLRFAVGGKPNALIVDFFAGSGTTLHATNLLNTEDEGNRRCILVTNNEVSEAEAKVMRKKGLKPGDDEWEAFGIARYVTWPRTVCSIKGENIKGEKLNGKYVGIDTPMSEGFKANANFFKLGFLNPTEVALWRQFKELLPVLWMKADAVGPCPILEKNAEVPRMMILPENEMAILTDETAYYEFSEKLEDVPGISTVFIVTDSDRGYREMANGLNVEKTYQLYKSYLDNFRINHNRR